ncbi:DivIVA domain-containing protein [Corynebacterium sp. H127]
MTWLLYIIGLVIVVALLSIVFGKLLGRGEVMPPLVDTLPLQELNRDAISHHNFAAVRFDTVIRGYRQDQVDAVITQLVAELEEARSAL